MENKNNEGSPFLGFLIVILIIAGLIALAPVFAYAEAVVGVIVSILGVIAIIYLLFQNLFK